jgi:peptide/nickel transport system permease protein
MQRYVLRRLAYLPLIVVAVSAITFFALRAPWARDPIVAMTGQNATNDAALQEEQRLRESLNLDEPVLEQFGIWLGQIVRGDLGTTYRGRQPVAHEVWERLPATVEILVLSIAFSSVLGVTFGVISAARQDTPIDYFVRFFAVFGQSIPDFFLLTLLIVLPSLWWNYSPPIGGHVDFFDHPLENLRLYLPPTLVLAVGGSAAVMRVTRSTMLEVLRQDYIRTAEAKGLGRRTVLLRHGFRNALVPIITILGSYLTVLFFGALILELLFSINGLGQFFFTSVLLSDFPVVQFLVLYTAVVIVVLNLLIDLSYAFIDPRVQYR